MNNYYKVPEVLVTGCEMVSPHLEWLLRNAAIATCGSDNINILAFVEEHEELFGKADYDFKGIVVYLINNVANCIDKIAGGDNQNISFKALLIHELLDTVIHESVHLKLGTDVEMDFSEQEAVRIAKEMNWKIAKELDVNIEYLGKFIEDNTRLFIDGLREDTKETAVMWKDLQIFMYDNNLGYYDPDKEVRLSIYQTFEAMSKDENVWTSKPATFIVPVEAPEPELIQTVTTPEPVIAKAEEVVVENKTQSFAGYEDYETGGVVTPVVATPVVPTQTTVPEVLTTQEIVEVCEKVWRKLFLHVQTKCGFTKEGTYNNSLAVLEGVNITDIPNFKKVFTNMDHVDTLGQYKARQPIEDVIKGCIQQNGMPQYKLYINFGGTLHYRTLMCASPDSPTWGKEAKQGVRRMYVKSDEPKGMKAIITLRPDQKFGQEDYVICK